jgi:hypothetical protein
MLKFITNAQICEKIICSIDTIQVFLHFFLVILDLQESLLQLTLHQLQALNSMRLSLTTAPSVAVAAAEAATKVGLALEAPLSSSNLEAKGDDVSSKRESGRPGGKFADFWQEGTTGGLEFFHESDWVRHRSVRF